MSHWSKVLAGCFVLTLGTGCGYDGDDVRRGDPSPGFPRETSEAIIDANEFIDVEPGEGVGLFVEYETGGRWRIFVTCDTEFSGFACLWDILVVPTDGTIDVIEEDDLEFEDFLDFSGDDGARLVTETGFGLDGAFFEAPAGEGLVIDALLDDTLGHRYFYWVGDGALHAGAPSTPLELTPNEP